MEEDRRVLFAVKAKGETVTLVVQLFIDRAQKKSIRNFYNLVTSNSDASYKSTKFTRVVSPEFIIQGGAIEGFYGELAVANEFNPESTALNERGLIVLASDRTQESSSEFFITLDDFSDYESLQGRFLVVGKVVNGLDQLIEVSKEIDVDLEERPVEDIVIVRTGELRKKSSKNPTEQSIGIEESSKREKASESDRRSDRRHYGHERHSHSSSDRHHHHHSSRSRRDHSRDRDNHRESSGRHHYEGSYKSRNHGDSVVRDRHQDRYYDRSYRPNYHGQSDYMDRDPKRLKSSASRSTNEEEIRKGRGFRH